MKKLLLLVPASLFALSCLSLLAQQAGVQEGTGTQASVREVRFEGKVVAANKAKSSLIIQNPAKNMQKTIHYDDSTKWVSQEHGSKQVNDIDAGKVKEGDRVICIGWEDKTGFHAALISKRLTPR